ncbi:hypothetical protein HNQ91_002137 [Filimonas zeae]|uniref:hypothetical protein n=1 Tax=Filimonas zeae TaxID=1737353 RepID=UPI00166D013C|nr:hypothetical protein [Filimonas zeae]MDR6339086.1 hypothetical protein [Filimonas zeae]
MRFFLLNPVLTGKVLLRVCRLLFKRKNRLQVLYVRYTYRYLFQQSYLVIQCRCSNSLWLSVAGYGVFAGEYIVLNLSKLAHSQLQLTVQGFFTKRKYYLEVEPQWHLQTQTFKTEMADWAIPVAFSTDMKLTYMPIKVCSGKITGVPAIAMKVPPVAYVPALFNQADYI